MCCGPTATMTTSRACARKGMPSATVSAVSVLPPRLVAPLVPLALQRAVDLRGDREPHLAAEHDRIFRRQAVQPNDVAVEAPGDQQGGLEDRARAAVADHRQEVLHRRLPIPRASITRLACTRCAIIANPGDSGDRAPPALCSLFGRVRHFLDTSGGSG